MQALALDMGRTHIGYGVVEGSSAGGGFASPPDFINRQLWKVSKNLT